MGHVAYTCTIGNLYNMPAFYKHDNSSPGTSANKSFVSVDENTGSSPTLTMKYLAVGPIPGRGWVIKTISGGCQDI